MAENKSIVISDVVPVSSKITDYKLNGSNHLEWSKIDKLYLCSIDKDDYTTDDEPKDENTKKTWLREDAKLFFANPEFY